MSSIYDWSLFAAGNANADDIINWAEGQPPGSVNNSARSMMQRVREFVADLGGVVTAGGTGNTITLTATSPVSAYTNGIIIRFRALNTNTDKTTVNMNNLGARPIVKPTVAGIIALSGGEIQAGGIYELVYGQTLNGGGGGWFLSAPTPAPAIPAGMISSFAMPLPPEGWLICNGAEVSRTTYSSLFAAIGTWWGAGDDATTFKLPDLRGIFVRGWDNGRGFDSGRSFASQQDSQNKAHNHGGSTSADGNHAHFYSDTTFYNALVAGAGRSAYGAIKETQQLSTETQGAHKHTIPNDGGTEARPVNIALLHAIKV